MKTVLDIAKECGADLIDKYNEYWLEEGDILIKSEAQLTATIDLCNRQNSEPIYQVWKLDGYWQDCHKNNYELAIPDDKRIVYLAPPQPQTVRDALKKAAKICEELGEKHHALGKDNQNHMYISGGCDACDYAIRALIDQPAEQPPASQELLDHMDRLESALSNLIMVQEYKEQFGKDVAYESMRDNAWKWAYKALQSKPAKELI